MDPARVLMVLRSGAEDQRLTPFFRRSCAIELLMMLYTAEEQGQELGVEDCFDALVIHRPTRGTFGRLYATLLEKGAIVAEPSPKKRSKRRLRLSESVRVALEEAFAFPERAVEPEPRVAESGGGRRRSLSTPPPR